MEKEIMLEKSLEAIYDQLMKNLPAELRKSCPITKFLADVIIGFKENNNFEVALDLGIVKNKEMKCPDYKKCRRLTNPRSE